MNSGLIATGKVIRTFLIVETLDLLSLEPSAFCPSASAFCYNVKSELTLSARIRAEILRSTTQLALTGLLQSK